MTLGVSCGAVYRTLQMNGGENLLDAMRENGFSLTSPCGGNGTCQKCRVTVRGECNAPTPTERACLTPDELAAGIRLACQTAILGDCQVVLPWQDKENMTIPDIEAQMAVGICVDIGTTTVEMAWYDLKTGQQLFTLLRQNPQQRYGSDVVSRLEYAREHGGQALCEEIRTLLREMIACGGKTPQRMVITGNTVMLHFLWGLDTNGFCAMPFHAQSLFGVEKCSDQGVAVYFPPCISPFVGADITCAVLAAHLTGGTPALLADFGTNGEIAYWNGQTLNCCATAAGPAFEGMGLSYGMSALPGAVYQAAFREEKVVCNILGGGKARGICGSGIVSLLGVLRRLEKLEDSGFLPEPYRLPDTKIEVTPKDVRMIQLAKAAIAAGIVTLCPSEQGAALSRFVIAGSFGKYLNVEAAVDIGLLPGYALNKCEIIGNGALTGAAMLLLNEDERKRAQQIVQQAKIVGLATDPAFLQRYTDSMYFTRID